MAQRPQRSFYGLLSAIARSGECIDCAAIEAKLLRLGFSAAEAREALADDDDRMALQAICLEAHESAREKQRMKDEATSRHFARSR